jgi:hypothetical protein
MVFDPSNVLSILVATLAISGAAYATYHFRTRTDIAQLSGTKTSTQSSGMFVPCALLNPFSFQMDGCSIDIDFWFLAVLF